MGTRGTRNAVSYASDHDKEAITVPAHGLDIDTGIDCLTNGDNPLPRTAMDLNEVLIFARVAEVGSFAQAARELRMPKSTVSRKVSDLEARLGVRLLQRTTRKLSLTDAGRLYFDHAARIVAELEQAEVSVTRMQEVPRGLLRVTAPLGFKFLACMVTDFLRLHPEVEVTMSCTDRVVDLVEEGFDLAIRAGALTDSSLVARLLGHERWLVIASADYLEKHGAPAMPSELDSHSCIVFFGGGMERTTWTLERDGTSAQVNVPSRLVVNDIDMVKEAAVAGLGIAMLPTSRCIDDLRTKRLHRVLPEWQAPTTPIHVVYPSTRHLSPKVRVFIDHLRARMTPPPWEQGPGL